MPPFELTTTSTTARSLVGGEIGLITPTGALVSASVTMSAESALVSFGSITATSAAVSVTNGAFVTIQNHGAITGGGSLGTIDAYTPNTANTRVNLLNTGTISTLGLGDASAFISRTGGQYIVNAGTMSAAFDSTIEIYDELTTPDTGNTIINTGLISGITGPTIYVNNDANDRLNNSGRIVGDVQFTGQLLANDKVTNSGEIDGGLSMLGGTLLNSGLITGDIGMYGDGRVVNGGVIDGELILTGSNVTVDLRGGIVRGGIDAGFGNNLYLVSDTLTSIFDVFGSDTMRAWCDVEIAPGVETLELRGNAVTGTGNLQGNTIFGSTLDNVLNGGVGNDSLIGGHGNDTLNGDDGSVAQIL